MKNNDKRISIIVPIYNVEKYLDKCVESIANQTYKNLEIILVDDGSPDGCPQKCDEWAKKDKRIKVIHKTNGGLSDARNAGLEIATGEFIGFVDADDYIDLTMFEKLLKTINTNNVDLALCGIQRVDELGQKIDYKEVNLSNTDEHNIINAFFSYNFYRDNGKICTDNIMASVWRFLYKKEAINSNRFVKNLYCEDIVFNLQVIGQKTKIAVVNEPLYYYLIRQGSTLRTYNEKKITDILNLARILRQTLTEKKEYDLANISDFNQYRRIIMTCINSPDKELYKKVKKLIKQSNLNTKKSYKAFNKRIKSKKERFTNYLIYKRKMNLLKSICNGFISKVYRLIKRKWKQKLELKIQQEIQFFQC